MNHSINAVVAAGLLAIVTSVTAPAIAMAAAATDAPAAAEVTLEMAELEPASDALSEREAAAWQAQTQGSDVAPASPEPGADDADRDNEKTGER